MGHLRRKLDGVRLTGCLLTAVVGIIVVAAAVVLWAPSWVAFAAGVVVAAAVGTLMDEYGPTTVERLVEIQPLDARAGADGAAHSDGWTLFMPGGARSDLSLPERPTAEEVRSRFIEHGAYDFESSELRLSLLGRSRDPAQVLEIRARIIDRPHPRDGVIIRYPSAGESRVIRVELNLDEDQPRSLSDGRPYFDNYVLTLAHREIQDLRIAARASISTVEWELEIDYSWYGDHRTLRLDNDGQPFRTAPRVDADRTYTWQWFEPRQSLALEPLI